MNTTQAINTIRERLASKIIDGWFVMDFALRVANDGGTSEAASCIINNSYVPVYTSQSDSFAGASFIYIYVLTAPETGNADVFVYDMVLSVKICIESEGTAVSTRMLTTLLNTVRKLVQETPRTKVGALVSVQQQNAVQNFEVMAGREIGSYTLDYLARFQG
jgi:hypothetical protein